MRIRGVMVTKMEKKGGTGMEISTEQFGEKGEWVTGERKERKGGVLCF